MKRRTRYVFGAALAGVALGGVPGLIQQANAAPMTVADFTFEQFTNAGSTTQSGAFSTGVSFVAESYTGTAYAFHSVGATITSGPTSALSTVTIASSATVFSSPAGNGSAHSLSSQNWAPGDYYEFVVPTTLINGILLTFDQTSSATGPGVFNLLYSTDGTNFNTFTTYTIPFSGTSTAFSTPSNTLLSFSFDLSTITGLNLDPNAIFEVQDASTAPFNPATNPFSSGSDRIDNVIVSGTPVPEPASLTLLSVVAAAALYRRRPVERA